MNGDVMMRLFFLCVCVWGQNLFMKQFKFVAC